MKEPSEIANDKTAVVFVHALRGSFFKLMEIAEEIDKENSPVPKPVL
jgi:hypothetical protein